MNRRNLTERRIGWGKNRPLRVLHTALLVGIFSLASAQAAASCSTMYGLTSSYTTVATGGTSPILTPTDQIQEITTSGTGGNIITKLPPIVSRNGDNTLRVDAYALGVSPDGRYFFTATNSTNSTDKNAFYYYDTQTGTWSAPFPLAAANSGAYQGPQRMVVTQSGIGYFSRNNYLYTFNANNPAAGIQGPFTMTAVYPNPQFPAPTPADINGGGDFVADTAGNLYVLSQPGTKDTNGNLIYDGIFDLFKITGSGSSYTATFLGRVTTTKQNNPMVTWTGTAVVNNELYVQNNLGTMLKINLGNFETTTVTSAGKQTSDLASCSYLAVSPTIVSTKTVSDVNGGTVLVGDTLEYTITVRNAGNLLATQATFQDAIPAGTTYVAGSTSLNGTAVADVSGNMPYATTSINSPGQSSGVLLTDGASSNAAVIKFRVRINTGTTSVSNQGTVSTVEGGTVRTDDPSTPAANDATVTPVAQPDLTITKTGPAYAKPSIAAQPTATASSSGIVTVTDTLPAGLTATAISGTGWTCTLSTLTCTRSDVLAPGSSYPDLTVTVQAPFDSALETTPALRDFTNTAAISGGSDGNLTNNSASANTKMVYAKLLKTTRNVSRNTAFGTSSSGLPGEVLEYCIAFTNFGGAALDTFVINDSVPGNTAALLTAYDAEEPGNVTGFGVKLTRGAVTYYTSAADTDQGTLSSAGGTYASGLMTTALGTLNVGETGNTCFQVTIR